MIDFSPIPLPCYYLPGLSIGPGFRSGAGSAQVLAVGGTVTYKNGKRIHTFKTPPSYQTGDRTGSITISLSKAVGNGAADNLIDGGFGNNSTDAMSFTAGSAAGEWVKFDFGSVTGVIEAKFHHEAGNHGTWKWQGSNNDSDWTDVTGDVTLGGGGTSETYSFSGGAYQYYRVLGVSGTFSTGIWNQEFEFKTAPELLTFLEGGTVDDILVVAGGASGGISNTSGGNAPGGGGAGGGVRTIANQVVTAQAYTIIVGAGGAPNTVATTASNAGGDSIWDVGGDDFTANGGGPAGCYNGADNPGLTGGSGGGGSAGAGTGDVGGAGNEGSFTPAEGFNGGDGAGQAGGGGGGASAVGGDGSTPNAGAGGAGDASSISGSPVTYGGGGGGGTFEGIEGAGGAGGGGAGGDTLALGPVATAGTDGLGGGGGGAATLTGAKGGDGIVIISYTYTNNLQASTGGVISYANGWRIHEFDTSGTLTPSGAGAVDYLSVAGGGGAGFNAGGGGGGGGVRTNEDLIDFEVTATGLTVTVGSGGAGDTDASGAGADGNASVFSTITSGGGGGGGTASGAGAAGNATDGSGGGAQGAGGSSDGTGGDGGTGVSNNAGGGGGASSDGTDGVGTTGGNGGAGAASSISGASVTYGGGGGGRGSVTGGTGGSGGGGDGTVAGVGNAGTDGLGGGGGGGGSVGGAGGSGKVVVRYPEALELSEINTVGLTHIGFAVSRPDALDDGNEDQAHSAATLAGNSEIFWQGWDLATAMNICGARLVASNSRGFKENAAGSMTFQVRGHTSDPASDPTAGTLIGELTGTDANSVVLEDKTWGGASFRYVWITFVSSDTGSSQAAEFKLFERS